MQALEIECQNDMNTECFKDTGTDSTLDVDRGRYLASIYRLEACRETYVATINNQMQRFDVEAALKAWDEAGS